MADIIKISDLPQKTSDINGQNLVMISEKTGSNYVTKLINLSNLTKYVKANHNHDDKYLKADFTQSLSDSSSIFLKNNKLTTTSVNFPLLLEVSDTGSDIGTRTFLSLSEGIKVQAFATLKGAIDWITSYINPNVYVKISLVGNSDINMSSDITADESDIISIEWDNTIEIIGNDKIVTAILSGGRKKSTNVLHIEKGNLLIYNTTFDITLSNSLNTNTNILKATNSNIQLKGVYFKVKANSTSNMKLNSCFLADNNSTINLISEDETGIDDTKKSKFSTKYNFTSLNTGLITITSIGSANGGKITIGNKDLDDSLVSGYAQLVFDTISAAKIRLVNMFNIKNGSYLTLSAPFTKSTAASGSITKDGSINTGFIYRTGDSSITIASNYIDNTETIISLQHLGLLSTSEVPGATAIASDINFIKTLSIDNNEYINTIYSDVSGTVSGVVDIATLPNQIT